MTEMQTPLGRVRRYGSTHDGAPHWWAERIGAVALVPLSLWFVFSVVSLVGADLVQFQAWLGRHGNLLLLVLFVIAMFHHAYLGLSVVMEDYIHNEAAKVVSMMAARFVAFASATSCILAALRVAFAGG